MTQAGWSEVEAYLSPAFRTIEWREDRVVLLDQRRLPGEEVYLELGSPEEVADAIRDLAVRGAPAIGVAAAMGLALAARCMEARDAQELVRELEAYRGLFLGTRPTAVNLRWAVSRLWRRIEKMREGDAAAIRWALEEEAGRIFSEDVLTNVAIGEAGAELVPQKGRVLTHCNAGALATAGYGTALGVVRAAWRRGKNVEVLADETRPFFQGARLTAWELQKDGIPVTVITDSMAGHFMQRQEVSVVIVGADRIAANGDVANKIGTYSLAVLAHENGIPFYVAAPLSTFDATAASGDEIPIEERDPMEVLEWGRVRIAPEGTKARYPAFDITPNRLISGIIMERGILRAPFDQGIRSVVGESGKV
jgi:methylthioribose-1-phosphate isomerase